MLKAALGAVFIKITYHAVMAELADALASGASGGNTLEVQVLLTAPYHAVVAELADALL